MNNTKFYSEKSKAHRALKSIGDGALAAAAELLIKGPDGRWGFDRTKAEEAQYNAAASKCEISKLLMPKGLPPSSNTVQVRAGKRVGAQASAPIVIKREFKTGYFIERDRPTQNGVKRPSSGTLCGQVWSALDAEQTPTAKRVKELATQHGWNTNNALCEYYAWRKFHGIKGRSAAQQPVARSGEDASVTGGAPVDPAV